MIPGAARSIVVGALALTPAVASAAPPQQAPGAGTPGSSAAGILLRLEQPAPPAPADSVTADDLRELPRPRPDRLPGNVQIRIGVEDPRCLPGEDPFLDRAGRAPLPRR